MAVEGDVGSFVLSVANKLKASGSYSHPLEWTNGLKQGELVENVQINEQLKDVQSNVKVRPV